MSKLYKALGAVLVPFAFLLSACSEATLGTKSLTEDLPVSTFPGSPIPVALPEEITVPLSADADSVADSTQFVTFARLRELRLDILDASEQQADEDGAMDDFDFLAGLEVYITARFGGQDRQALIASLPEGDPQIASGTRTLALTVTNADVLDYIEAPSGFSLKVRGMGMTPPDNVVFGGQARFRVGLGLKF